MVETDTSLHLRATVCVVGGGPAGIMSGLLLARSGIDVIVLEKHADFFRDFRGDTVHPSTLELLDELGLLDEFLKRPHQKVHRLTAEFGDESLVAADFSHLPVRCPYIALIPQWDFLDLLTREAKKYPFFQLIMQAQATEVIEEGERVIGVRAQGPQAQHLIIHADLVIGADGRHSTIREDARLAVEDIGAPIDVLWMRLSRRPEDPSQPYVRFDHGQGLVLINRDQYYQCGFLIEKGSLDRLREQGLPAFRKRIASLAPFVADRVAELNSWDDIKLLNVRIDRLRRWWRPGLLCIGDAAHAMSPVGGIGINLAIQDAVAAANILVEPLRKRSVTTRDLKAVQDRRMFPVLLAQRFQRVIQDHVIGEALAAKGPAKMPRLFRLLGHAPFFRRFMARWIGLGVRPEHIRTRPFEPRSVSQPASADL